MRNKAFWENDEMTAVEKLVFICIRDWGDKPLSSVKIAEYTRLDRKTIFRALKSLEQKEILTRQRVDRANIFTIVL